MVRVVPKETPDSHLSELLLKREGLMNRSGMPSLRVVWHDPDGNRPPRRSGSGVNGKPQGNGQSGGERAVRRRGGRFVGDRRGGGEWERADGATHSGVGRRGRRIGVHPPPEWQAFTAPPEKPGLW